MIDTDLVPCWAPNMVMLFGCATMVSERSATALGPSPKLIKIGAHLMVVRLLVRVVKARGAACRCCGPGHLHYCVVIVANARHFLRVLLHCSQFNVVQVLVILDVVRVCFLHLLVHF